LLLAFSSLDNAESPAPLFLDGHFKFIQTLFERVSYWLESRMPEIGTSGGAFYEALFFANPQTIGNNFAEGCHHVLSICLGMSLLVLQDRLVNFAMQTLIVVGHASSFFSANGTAVVFGGDITKLRTSHDLKALSYEIVI
jgi:hypothetical protein